MVRPGRGQELQQGWPDMVGRRHGQAERIPLDRRRRPHRRHEFRVAKNCDAVKVPPRGDFAAHQEEKDRRE